MRNSWCILRYFINDFFKNCNSGFRDLKRDVAKKLEKLERRTQRAIAELIRQYFLLCFCLLSLHFREATEMTVPELGIIY